MSSDSVSDVMMRWWDVGGARQDVHGEVGFLFISFLFFSFLPFSPYFLFSSFFFFSFFLLLSFFFSLLAVRGRWRDTATLPDYLAAIYRSQPFVAHTYAPRSLLACLTPRARCLRSPATDPNGEGGGLDMPSACRGGRAARGWIPQRDGGDSYPRRRHMCSSIALANHGGPRWPPPSPVLLLRRNGRNHAEHLHVNNNARRHPHTLERKMQAARAWTPLALRRRLPVRIGVLLVVTADDPCSRPAQPRHHRHRRRPPARLPACPPDCPPPLHMI